MQNVVQMVSLDHIKKSILLIRGHKVMLDTTLAELYGVTTKALNQAVRRNLDRFPPAFMFTLTTQEKEEVVTNCDHLHPLKFSHVLPKAFTEHGTIMLANVLRSKRAIQTSIAIIQAFVHLREILSTHKDLIQKMTHLEKKYDHQFKVVFDAIRQLMEPPVTKKRKIGFVNE